MRVAVLRKIPWISLILLLLTYSLLGWYLSAFDPIWSLSFLIAVVALTMVLIWGTPKLLRWLRIGAQQGWLVASSLTIVTCLAVLVSGVFAQVVMLLAAELLVRMQMQTAGFSKNHTLWVLTVAAGLGLGLGWMTGITLPRADSGLIQLGD